MSAVAERTQVVQIGLERDCLDEGCAALADRMHTQLGVPNYSRGAAVMPVPESVEAWRAAHRTARKRADRAARLGYRFDTIDRSQHNDAIHEINTSKQERQGRPMTAGYLQRHSHGPLPVYPCDRHRVHTYGVLLSGGAGTSADNCVVRQPAVDNVLGQNAVGDARRLAADRAHDTPSASEDPHASSLLVAYLSLYVVGELHLISMILGHGDHLANDVMYLLAAGTIAEHVGNEGVFFYNTWNSGTDGLRYFKSKIGFERVDIKWSL